MERVAIAHCPPRCLTQTIQAPLKRMVSHPPSLIPWCASALTWACLLTGCGPPNARADDGPVPRNRPREIGTATPTTVIPLTKIAGVYNVPRDVDGLSVPVDIEGVVIFTVEESASFFIHDGQMGIHVSQRNGTRVQMGDRIRIIGDTRRGRYAPSIIPRQVVPLGKGAYPRPRPAFFEQVSSGSMDSQWIELEGVVHAAEFTHQKRKLQLSLTRNGVRVRVIVDHPLPVDPAALLDAEVRVHGVATARFNEHGQMIEPVLRLADPSWFNVTRHSPADPFALPRRGVSRLMAFSMENQMQHRIKVRGVMTRRMSATTFFLRDEGHGVKVENHDPVPLQSGDQIEVVGFPIIIADEVVLQNAVTRRMATGLPPPPVPSDLPDLLSGTHRSDLVRLQARLIDWMEDGGATTLILGADNHLFKGVYQTPDKADWRLPENGSLVEVAGIAVASRHDDPWQLRSSTFSLLLASPQDLTVLKSAPWWTAGRLWRALITMLALLLVGFGWVWSLRRQVRRKSSIIGYQAGHAAILEERSRIARDLHDTLEQGLTGLSLQLKAIETELGNVPRTISSQLSLARHMLRQSRSLARDAIRDLRIDRLPVKPASLIDALEHAVKTWNASQLLTMRLQVHGQPQTIPDEVMRHLSLIACEAMSNAVKHGQATEVSIDLTYGLGTVGLRVTDNGRGFDPADADHPNAGKYGLLGMRERAVRIGARLEIGSQQGRGTTIEVQAYSALVSEDWARPPQSNGMHPVANFS